MPLLFHCSYLSLSPTRLSMCDEDVTFFLSVGQNRQTIMLSSRNGTTTAQRNNSCPRSQKRKCAVFFSTAGKFRRRKEQSRSKRRRLLRGVRHGSMRERVCGTLLSCSSHSLVFPPPRASPLPLPSRSKLKELDRLLDVFISIFSVFV